MSRLTLLLFLCVLLLVAFAAPALAASPFDVSWSALDPGDDWAAQMINAVFPINGTQCSGNNCTGNAATVVGQIVGQLTGFVLAIAMFFICYQTLVNIHRVSESSQILTSSMTWLGVVRIGFAAIMMFPLQSGFSEGQALVVKASMWGITSASSTPSCARVAKSAA
jgi:conjugal transfer/type IV secretion protein DotA/TraY